MRTWCTEIYTSRSRLKTRNLFQNGCLHPCWVHFVQSTCSQLSSHPSCLGNWQYVCHIQSSAWIRVCWFVNMLKISFWSLLLALLAYSLWLRAVFLFKTVQKIVSVVATILVLFLPFKMHWLAVSIFATIGGTMIVVSLLSVLLPSQKISWLPVTLFTKRQRFTFIRSLVLELLPDTLWLAVTIFTSQQSSKFLKS